jgi:hypothetical protein
MPEINNPVNISYNTDRTVKFDFTGLPQLRCSSLQPDYSDNSISPGLNRLFVRSVYGDFLIFDRNADTSIPVAYEFEGEPLIANNGSQYAINQSGSATLKVDNSGLYEIYYIGRVTVPGENFTIGEPLVADMSKPGVYVEGMYVSVKPFDVTGNDDGNLTYISNIFLNNTATTSSGSPQGFSGIGGFKLNLCHPNLNNTGIQHIGSLRTQYESFKIGTDIPISAIDSISFTLAADYEELAINPIYQSDFLDVYIDPYSDDSFYSKIKCYRPYNTGLLSDPKLYCRDLKISGVGTQSVIDISKPFGFGSGTPLHDNELKYAYPIQMKIKLNKTLPAAGTQFKLEGYTPIW